jgi:hypothetical protein
MSFIYSYFFGNKSVDPDLPEVKDPIIVEPFVKDQSTQSNNLESSIITELPPEEGSSESSDDPQDAFITSKSKGKRNRSNRRKHAKK